MSIDRHVKFGQFLLLFSVALSVQIKSPDEKKKQKAAKTTTKIIDWFIYLMVEYLVLFKRSAWNADCSLRDSFSSQAKRFAKSNSKKNAYDSV